MEYKTIDDLGDLNGKVVMLRADLNVPMDENFHVTNTARIDRTVPTVKELMSKGAKVVVISHFGRPEGKGDMKNSLSHIVKDMEKALGHKVVFVDDCIGPKVAEAIKNMKADEVLLLENLRFYNEEKKGDEKFAEELVKPADVYVSDAFSTAHRAHGCGGQAAPDCNGPLDGRRSQGFVQWFEQSTTPADGCCRRFQGFHQTRPLE